MQPPVHTLLSGAFHCAPPATHRTQLRVRSEQQSDAAGAQARPAWVTELLPPWVRSNVHRLWRQHVITWREVAEDTTRVIT